MFEGFYKILSPVSFPVERLCHDYLFCHFQQSEKY